MIAAMPLEPHERVLARRGLAALPRIALVSQQTPVHEMPSLRQALGGGPRLLIKRDDLIGFGFGGNKVRKLALVAARAKGEGCDTLVTTGGVQSNHARVTAAVAAHLGMRCVLVLNGTPPQVPSGNILLDTLLGAEIHYVGSRAERSVAMGALAERLAERGRRPFVIPLGASTSLGALGYAQAVGELVAQGVVPDVIVHSTSSGGTQAGLLAGCAIHDIHPRVLGVSADEAPEVLAPFIRTLVEQMGGLIGVPGPALARGLEPEVDAAFVGAGYGEPTAASCEAQVLLARTEGVFLDPTYTAKAMAGLIAYVREGRFDDSLTVLFWHTGGLPGIFVQTGHPTP
jgi:1-aminocyclopropane-1-carboxylate deaminase/D-cysteine desulfhydrase-like pyridoxal-dependent ACC family enzyme